MFHCQGEDLDKISIVLSGCLKYLQRLRQRDDSSKCIRSVDKPMDKIVLF